MDLKSEIVSWIKSYSSENGGLKLVVGISGGIDSATVSTLCALTGIETHVVSLPIHQNEEQLKLANKHIEWLESNFTNVISHKIDLTNVFSNFKNNLIDFDNNLGWANSRSRLRMMTLYLISNFYKGIVVGTGNKVEDFGVGFFTKYGDGGVDISPIADLMKSEVRELAKDLGIIKEILVAKPTDGLWEDDRTDEDQIGATYEELEWAMLNQVGSNERENQVLEIFQKFNTSNGHKMKPIPVFTKNPQFKYTIGKTLTKNLNVFQEFFIEKNPARLEEYIFCLNKNLQNKFVDNVYLFFDESEYNSNPEYFDKIFSERLVNNHKLITIKNPKPRFTFNTLSKYVNKNLPDGSIVFVANLDIFIPEIESWEKIDDEFFGVTDKNICLALARTEYASDENIFIDEVAWERGEFADAWCFKVPFLITDENFPYDIPVGNAPSCDNHMFGLMSERYDSVFNWAKKYVVYHFDIVRKPQVLETKRGVMILNEKSVTLPGTYSNSSTHFTPHQDWESILNNIKK